MLYNLRDYSVSSDVPAVHDWGWGCGGRGGGGISEVIECVGIIPSETLSFATEAAVILALLSAAGLLRGTGLT